MKTTRPIRWQFSLLPALALILGILISCSDTPLSPSQVISSRSYQGHASDADINNFVTVYQHTVGTRLDDCQTCHTGGEVTDDDVETVYANPCDYCHYVIHPPEDWTGLPTAFAQTLNPYGTAWIFQLGRD